MLSLFPDEKIVTQSSEGEVTLTTHRICYEYKEWGRSYNQSIMLEHITSCENNNSTQIWILILGVLFIFGGIFSGDNDVIMPFVALAVVCGLLYWFTRRNLVIVSSPSTKMQIKVVGMERTKVLDFINKIEQTKHQRISSLNNRPNIVS